MLNLPALLLGMALGGGVDVHWGQMSSAARFFAALGLVLQWSVIGLILSYFLFAKDRGLMTGALREVDEER